MKKVFAILLVLIMVLALLPARETKADGYTVGMRCPHCDNGYLQLFYQNDNETQHAFRCSNGACWYFVREFFWEDHRGETPICGRPICEVCGQEFGESVHDHDWDTDWTIEDRGHYHVCKRCGARKDEDTHNMSSSWIYVNDLTCKHVCEECGREEAKEHWFTGRTDNGDGTHSCKCLNCGYVKTEAHYGASEGEATCVAKKKCEAPGCYAEYGELDADNHYWRVTDHTNEDHTLTCSRGCGATKTEGHQGNWVPSYNDDSTHCLFCSVCCIYYREPHTFGDWEDAGDGVNHARSCECGWTVTEAHQGDRLFDSKASYHQSYCEICGLLYKKEEHTFSEWTDAGDGVNHVRSCACGRTQTKPHSGGEATGICEQCGAKYGGMTAPKPEPEPDLFTAFCRNLAQLIVLAQENEAVEADARLWYGLQWRVLEALEQRPDVSLTITCWLNGELTELTVPAGFDLVSSLEPGQFLHFSELVKLLG